MSNETKFLGALLPSSPDLAPIIKAMRDKYQLPEVYPKDDPIVEIFLGDEIIPISEFRNEIKNKILDDLQNIAPADFCTKYNSSKKGMDLDIKKDLQLIPKALRPALETHFEFMKQSLREVFKILDAQINSVADMLCFYILTGEAQKTPDEWFGMIGTSKAGDTTIINAVIGEQTDIDQIFQNIRALHKKTFGVKKAKLSKTAVNTAYYLQLKKSGKDWNFIVEQYIKNNKFSMPRDIKSDRYIKTWNMYAQRLKKRLKRTVTILEGMFGDKNS